MSETLERCQILEKIKKSAIASLNFMEKSVYSVDDLLHGITSSISTLRLGIQLSPAETEGLVRQLLEHFQTDVSLGIAFGNQQHEKWVSKIRKETEFYFWERYEDFLKSEGKIAPAIISVTDEVTDTILDYMENPRVETCWKNRGLVVGYVQSGKTLNYIGLMCKAADAGYKVIIVLSGILNALRKQTQIRIEEGFAGYNTAPKKRGDDPWIGVGKNNKKRRPFMGTKRTQDFSARFAASVPLNALKEPAVFVVKKNANTLKHLLNWLQENNHQLKDYPLLVIDDEADNASINTRASIDQVTTINGLIRELLKVFDRSAYVGYTATPFANIFINPDTLTEMHKDDLFPKDFIYSLDPPTNYFGPDKIFPMKCDFGDSTIITLIKEDDPDFPLAHKIDFQPRKLPGTLIDAIHRFLLVCAIRNLRGDRGKHNSMMVNVSRFTNVQSTIKHLIKLYLTDLDNAIQANCGLTDGEELSDSYIVKTYNIWNQEYSELEFLWGQVKTELLSVSRSIDIIEVNNSQTSAVLDYESHKKEGWNVIAVGGLSLSRGITLEGLSISYFLRNSKMYDTLMQMGRWFGFRPGYEDLCGIYLTKDTAEWYQHIADVLREMRVEFKEMKDQEKTPHDFGLRVRQHPGALLITARSKIGFGENRLCQINLSGRKVETSRLFIKPPEFVQHNWEMAHKLLESCLALNSNPEEEGLGKTKIWRNVPKSIVTSFPALCNYAGSVRPKTSMILRWMGLASV
jgi:hypothetical protein